MFLMLALKLVVIYISAKNSNNIVIVSAKSDQQVNICSFAVRCDRMWLSMR